nr:GDSL esterase/lipase LTL1-like [Aegilops tauschii subsp. strangulata]
MEEGIPVAGEYLGAEPALPYLSPHIVGANFASAGIGILNDTGVQFVNIIRIAQQLQNFQDYQRRLAAYIGEDAARERVSQSLVLITLGGNDFVNNYFLVPFSARSQQFEIHDYVPFIISEYKKVLAHSSMVHKSGRPKIPKIRQGNEMLAACRLEQDDAISWRRTGACTEFLVEDGVNCGIGCNLEVPQFYNLPDPNPASESVYEAKVCTYMLSEVRS